MKNPVKALAAIAVCASALCASDAVQAAGTPSLPAPVWTQDGVATTGTYSGGVGTVSIKANVASNYGRPDGTPTFGHVTLTYWFQVRGPGNAPVPVRFLANVAVTNSNPVGVSSISAGVFLPNDSIGTSVCAPAYTNPGCPQSVAGSHLVTVRTNTPTRITLDAAWGLPCCGPHGGGVATGSGSTVVQLAPGYTRAGYRLEFSVLPATPATVKEVYSARPLGSLGGTASHAAALNNAGQVVGDSRTSAGTTHAFVYANGTMSDLGTLPGGANSGAEGINLSGEIVGRSEVGPGSTFHATRWYGATATDIGLRAGKYSVAHSINDAGVIVGSVSSVDTWPLAGRWDNGSVTWLGVPGASSSAKSINHSGQVVGQQASPEPFGYLWNGTAATQLWNTYSDGTSDANGINDSGQVAGSAQVPVAGAGLHAMTWSGNGMPTAPVDLGTLGGLHSEALGINAAGQVVGYADTAGQVQHAVVWTNGQAVDLNAALGASEARYVTLTVATAINDQGWIVADGIDSRAAGVGRSYLLTPAAATCNRDRSRQPPGRARSMYFLLQSGRAGNARQARAAVAAGMTRDEAQQSSWGAPLRIDVATSGTLASEVWWYSDRRHLLFTNGCLKAIYN